MKSLKIQYIDEYGADFPYEKHISYMALSKYFSVQIVHENPDIVISFGYGENYLQYDTPKIILSCENMIFHPDEADICIVFKKDIYKDYPHKYFNYVHAMEYDGYDDLVRYNKRHAIYTPNPDKFCAFLYRNNKPNVRKIFCKELMKYKPVDCLGSVMRNTHHIYPRTLNSYNWGVEQLHIYNQYKFTIAFENMFTTDSITEKILQPLLVGSIPIYWGTENIKHYFNPDCFINVNDFTSFADCIAYVKKVDNDPELYQKYLSAPPVLPTSKLHDITFDTLADWLYPRVIDLLNHPETCVGAFDKKQLIKWWLWKVKASLKICIRMFLVNNVPMPLYKKIAYNLLYIPQMIYVVIKYLFKTQYGYRFSTKKGSISYKHKTLS